MALLINLIPAVAGLSGLLELRSLFFGGRPSEGSDNVVFFHSLSQRSLVVFILGIGALKLSVWPGVSIVSDLLKQSGQFLDNLRML